MSPQFFTDPSTHFRIEPSQTPVTVDGMAKGEPKRLVCEACGAAALITPDPTGASIEDLEHDRTCPQRFVTSEWWLDSASKY